MLHIGKQAKACVTVRFEKNKIRTQTKLRKNLFCLLVCPRIVIIDLSEYVSVCRRFIDEAQGTVLIAAIFSQSI